MTSTIAPRPAPHRAPTGRSPGTADTASVASENVFRAGARRAARRRGILAAQSAWHSQGGAEVRDGGAAASEGNAEAGTPGRPFARLALIDN